MLLRVRSCWAERLGAPDPWEVPYMNAQHWWLYVTRRDSAAHSHDETGQLCTNAHSSGLQAKSAPPPEKKHFQASLPGTIPPDTHLSARHHPPQMQTASPPLPPSSRCDLWLHEGVATLVVLRPTPAALKSSCGGQLMRASSTPLLLLRILLQPEKKAPEDGENYGGAVSPRTLTLY